MKSLLLLLFLLNFSFSLKLDVKLDKSDPFSNMSDTELEKMLKDMGVSSKEMNLLGSNEENISKKEISEGKKKQIETRPLTFSEMIQKNRSILKSFHLTQRDAFNLIHCIKKFPVFSKLPITAMNLLNEINNNPSYRGIEELHKNKTEETNSLISNTLNSQIFIDHENKMGRKGVLTMVDKNTGESENVWAVLNNKVFAVYKTSNFLNIIKIFRISTVKVKDSIYTPCFYLYYDNMHEEENREIDLKKKNVEKNINGRFFKHVDYRKKIKNSKNLEVSIKEKEEKLDMLKNIKLPPSLNENIEKNKNEEYSKSNFFFNF